MVSVYAEVGRANVAFQFFRSMGGVDPALGKLLSLAETYVLNNKAEDAVAALLAVGPDNGRGLFCQKEAALLTELAGKVSARQKADLVDIHARRCTKN